MGLVWGGIITFMFCTHTGTATGTALSSSVTAGVGWGGVGWDNNVHVPVHTQARQTHHLSCCPADTGTALSSSVTAGVG